ncbi:ATP-binding protein [Patescibacteria group bacterium]|nr:ATP-binding protein [Patescibacteria group bacterium]
MHINRQISQQIKRDILSSNKAVIIYGPRQVGKTTLANKLLDELNLDDLRINAEQTKYQDILSSQDVKKLKTLIGDHQLLFIDEARSIQNIGINLKLIHDHIPHLKVLVTGSSSFDLANKVSEPLTGRSWKYNLFPIAYSELSKIHSKFDLTDQLEERLIFGSYPQVITLNSYEKKQRYLQQLTEAYLFKDIFNFANIKHHSKIKQLLKLIAFQVGSEVSVHELANKLNISRDAVNNYLNLLEKSFVIFRLSGFSRNLRKEVSKMDKIFFYDLGVRNTIIDNFNLLNSRQDIGPLWENFLIAERLKKNSYGRHYCSSYFWRLHSGAEIDYLEEYGGGLHGYEFKWSNKKINAPKSWQETYPNSKFKLINRDNYLDLVI